MEGVWRLECHDELPSTSDTCLTRAEAGEADGLAVLAYRQTRGRGTRGRAWSDAGDSLALSVLLRPRPGMDTVADAPWSFISALAFYDGLSDGAMSPRLRVKWPNDILLDDRKLGGILVEASPGTADQGPARQGAQADGSRGWVVIGFGANLLRAPTVEGRELACLAEYSDDCATNAVAHRILDHLSHWRGVWERDGFAPIRRAWLDRAQPFGTPLVVKGGKTYVEGEFEGIGEGGQLLLRCGPELKHFVAGEILHGDAALKDMEAHYASGD